MKATYLSSKMSWLIGSVYFFKRHFAVILSLGLIAAFGRVIQLGGFGAITYASHIILELVIESARILIFLYVLGLSNIPDGLRRIKKFFADKEKRKLQWSTAVNKMKRDWFSISLNIAGFLIIASVVNFLIDQLAYETCLYLSLKQDGILAENSSEWTILLFFKNISVIPFTLVFNGLFLLWLTDKLKNQIASDG